MDPFQALSQEQPIPYGICPECSPRSGEENVRVIAREVFGTYRCWRCACPMDKDLVKVKEFRALVIVRCMDSSYFISVPRHLLNKAPRTLLMVIQAQFDPNPYGGVRIQAVIPQQEMIQNLNENVERFEDFQFSEETFAICIRDRLYPHLDRALAALNLPQPTPIGQEECSSCGNTDESVQEVTDPFQAEMYEKEVHRLLCQTCYDEIKRHV